MPSYLIKLARSLSAKYRVDDLADRFRALPGAFEEVETLQISSTSCDLELRWKEERFLHNVLADGKQMDIPYLAQRTANISFRKREKLCYLSRFGKRASILSSKELSDLNLVPVGIDLTSKFLDKSLEGRTLYNVRIVDLPVDQIPALKVEIPTCSIGSLNHLISGTYARITALSIELSERTILTLQSGGTIKISTPSDLPWSQAVSEIHSMIKNLNLE